MNFFIFFTALAVLAKLVSVNLEKVAILTKMIYKDKQTDFE